MFEDAWVFNQNISNWDTSKVTNMYAMFNVAKVFNQDISSWNTGLVTKMNSMFHGAYDFNQNIGSWNTSNVTDMSYMFYSATDFNNGAGAALNWNTNKVTNMSYMFGGTSVFNKPLNFTSTANVTNMSGMFYVASAFNQNISGWNTSKVTNMSTMFQSAAAFNQDISGWNVNLVNQYSNFDTTTNVGWIASEKPIWVLAPSGTNKKIFVTATSYDGDLGGITGADAKCMADANYPGSGTYKALLGATTRKVLPSASGWVLIGGANYLRANDSTLVTTALANKTFGVIMNPFSAAGDFFWAGLDESAWTVSADNCTDWTSNDVATLGEASTVTNWTMSLLSCDTTKPLLCVEQ
jgi:surface protein